MKLIQPDSWPIRFLSKLCDLIFLNMMFILACMTIVLSGTAFTALYTVTLKMIRGKEYVPVKDFLQSIRENFISSVPATILLFVNAALIAFLFTALYAEVLLISPAPFVLLSIAAILFTALLSYLFPLLAQFENTFPQHLINAGKLAIINLPVTFLLTAVNLLPLLLPILFSNLFGYFAAFWLLMGIAAGAYLNSFYLSRIFDR